VRECVGYGVWGGDEVRGDVHSKFVCVTQRMLGMQNHRNPKS
jgi:hypothetical protein